MHSYALLAQAKILQGFSGSNSHLGLNEIDVGDFLSDGVFYLNSWVHFDEHVLALVRTYGVH